MRNTMRGGGRHGGEVPTGAGDLDADVGRDTADRMTADRMTADRMASGAGASVAAMSGPSATVPFGRQLADLRLTLLSVVLAIGAVAAAALALSRAFDLELYAVTADPAAVAERPFAVGLVSYLGLLGWAGAAAMAMVGAAILYAIDPWSERGRMLFTAGALSALLALDDAFMLHEKVLPDYLFAPEQSLYVLYAVLAMVFLHLGRRYLRGTDWLLLVLAGAALATSLAMDLLLAFDGRVTFVEDFAKFSGVVLWATYLFRTVRTMATRTVNERLLQLRRRQHGTERAGAARGGAELAGTAPPLSGPSTG